MLTCLPFFNALRQCVLESIRVGLFVSALLTFIILMLGNFAQAEVPQETWNTDTQILAHPAEMKSGGLLFKGDDNYQTAPLLHTDVHIVITGMIARAKVKQSFRNPTNEWKEGIYVFPLADSAAVDHMRMHIGERIIEGQIK